MKLHTFSIAAALMVVSAQAQQTSPPAQPSTNQTEGTAADRTAPGQTQTQGAAGQPGTDQRGQQDTAPSTSPTEGTAADRTAPGRTPTQGQGATQTSPGATPQTSRDAMPSTSPTEGTAADRTQPGQTPTTQGSQAMQRGAQRSDIVGAAVVSSSDAPLGEVVDVVFDASNQPEFVVIQSQGKAMAMPYSAANSMKKEDKIVVDQSRLQSAPKVEEGAWRNPASSRWKQESTRYWGRG